MMNGLKFQTRETAHPCMNVKYCYCLLFCRFLEKAILENQEVFVFLQEACRFEVSIWRRVLF